MVGRRAASSARLPAGCSRRRRAGGAAARRPRHRRDNIADADHASLRRSGRRPVGRGARSEAVRSGPAGGSPGLRALRAGRRGRANAPHGRKTRPSQLRDNAPLPPRAAASLRAPRRHSARRRRDEPSATRSGFLRSRSSTRRTTGPRRCLLTQRFPPLEVVSRINTARLARSGCETRTARRFRREHRGTRHRRTASGPALLAGLSARGGIPGRALPVVARLALSLQRRWREARRSGPLSPLERALALVDWTRRGATTPKTGVRRWRHSPTCSSRTAPAPLAETTRELAWARSRRRRERAAEAGSRGAPHSRGTADEPCFADRRDAAASVRAS